MRDQTTTITLSYEQIAAVRLAVRIARELVSETGDPVVPDIDRFVVALTMALERIPDDHQQIFEQWPMDEEEP